jgi:hypothetical protein
MSLCSAAVSKNAGNIPRHDENPDCSGDNAVMLTSAVHSE